MQKLLELRSELQSFKIFNGMLVHDFRGPVTSMIIVLQHVDDMIQSINDSNTAFKKIVDCSADFDKELLLPEITSKFVESLQEQYLELKIVEDAIFEKE